MKNNEGIIIKGGKINANQLAVGRSATIIAQPSSQYTVLTERVDALLTIIEAEKDNIEDFDEVNRAGKVAKNELGKEKPDINVIASLLGMISKSVPAISTITKAIKVVKEAIAVITI